MDAFSDPQNSFGVSLYTSLETNRSIFVALQRSYATSLNYLYKVFQHLHLRS